MQTLKFAVRSLLKTPTITAVAALSLALGIGANSAIFSVMENILLRSLPVEEPERLVNLCATGPFSGSVSMGDAGRCVFSHPMLRDLQGVEGVFDEVAGYRDFGVNLSFEGNTIAGEGMTVTGNYFAALGMQPALGRLLAPSDDVTPGAHSVVVLSHQYWTNNFANDPSLLNKPLTVNGKPMTIVGVAAPGFRGTTLGDSPDVFLPMRMREELVPEWEGLDNRRVYWIYSFARLSDGVSREAAEVAANQTFRSVIQNVELELQTGGSESYLERFAERTLSLEPGRRGQSSMIADSKAPLLLMLGVTGFVLLIACANVVNLLLTKAVNRTGEIALRMSLGARRGQVVSQLLAESLLLSLLGGVLGLAVARLTLWGLSEMTPGGGQAPVSLQIGGLTWAFLAGLTLVTSLVGLVPALKSTRMDLADAMKSQSTKASSTRSVIRLRMALAVFQVGLSLTLLIAAGLFVKSLVNVSRVDLGIDTPQLAMFGVSPELNGYTPDESLSFFARVEDEVAALPGVRSVSASLVPLIGGSSWGSNVSVQGYDAAPDEDTNARYNEIGPNYFSTLGTPLMAGREFELSDAAERPQVAIVNETFARRFELGTDALGTMMQIGSGGEHDIQIVGVVQDAKYSSVKEEIPPMFYLPYRQNVGLGSLFFYVRAEGEPSALLDTLRASITRLDANLPVESLQTLSTQVQDNIFVDSLMTKLSAAFAILATLLAAVGLYGALAYSVAQRQGEIGLRMALGADGAKVRGMILRQVGIMTAIGTVLGLAAAFGLGRAASSLLYELRGDDPLVFGIAALLLVAVAMASGLAPALRASRIDPMIALREE